MSDKQSLYKQLNMVDKLIREKIGEMISYFDDKLDKEYSTHLRKLWDIVSITSNVSVTQVNRLVAEESHTYFLLFEDMVADKKIDELLNYDFTQHIVPDTNPETRNLIMNLIDNIKRIYNNSDEETKEELWNFVKSLIKFSVLRKNTTSKLEKL